MKLSNKLLIGLLGIAVLLIIVQIYLSKDVAIDLERLYDPSYEELKAAKTFEVFEFSDITTLNLNSQEAIIRKGDRFEVFYQPIIHNKPKIKDGALFVNGREISREKVYIYIPDLKSLNLTNYNTYRPVTLDDFNGQDIHISVENGERTELVTNMSRFNLSGKHARILFYNYQPMDSLWVSLTNSTFRIQDLQHPINNLDINLERSDFSLELQEDTLLKNVKIKGSIAKYTKYRGMFYYEPTSGIYLYSDTLVCDTFDIDIALLLSTDSGYELNLPSNIKSQHYSVKTSDNIEITNSWQRVTSIKASENALVIH